MLASLRGRLAYNSLQIKISKEVPAPIRALPVTNRKSPATAPSGAREATAVPRNELAPAVQTNPFLVEMGAIFRAKKSGEHQAGQVGKVRKYERIEGAIGRLEDTC